MRVLALAWILFAVTPQDAPTSRTSVASDWCRVDFHAEHRAQALEFLRAAAPARSRIVERLGLDLGGTVTVLLVRDQDEMRNEVLARTGHEPPDWAGGLALPDRDLVIVRVDLPGDPFDRVDAIITHELVHIALARAGPPNGKAIPRWFEEGLAQWMAGRARPLDVPDLRPAATFGWLLGLGEMNAAFAHGEGAASRAYAQAESFVRFLARRGGGGAMREILGRLLDGVDLDVALRVAAGTSLETSWIAWQQDLASDRSWMIATGTQAFVAILILLVVALGVRRILRRKETIEAKWAKEGEPPPENVFRP